MIPRYSRPELERIWSDAYRYDTWLQVELAATEAMEAAGVTSARDVAARYTGKTLIICGKQDQRTPPELSEEMHARLSNSELHLLDECGHLPPMEQAEKTTELMRGWLVNN